MKKEKFVIEKVGEVMFIKDDVGNYVKITWTDKVSMIDVLYILQTGYEGDIDIPHPDDIPYSVLVQLRKWLLRSANKTFKLWGLFGFWKKLEKFIAKNLKKGV